MADRAGREVRWAQVADGVRLPWVEAGDAEGVPVVLLHGLADSWRCWEPVLDALPTGVRAVAPSQRGHGDADRPADGYDPANLARDLEGLLDEAGVEAAVVAGHSSAGLVAQRFAVDRPARTLGLVLIGGFARFPPRAVAAADAVLAGLEDPIRPAFVRAFQEGTMEGPAPAGFLETVVAESMKVPAHVWRATWAGVRDADLTGEAAGVAAPALLVWGDRDHLCPPADREALAASFPDARVAVYEGTAHSPHWERPARFAADLAAFCLRAGS